MAVVQTSGARRRAGFLQLTKVFNKAVLLLAGTPLLPLYGVLEHRGRRSGKTFHTPVVVRLATDGRFIVPMPWGLTTDWYRNIQTAGECGMRWQGRRYQLRNPEVIDRTTARAAFNGFTAGAMERFGIELCLRLERAP